MNKTTKTVMIAGAVPAGIVWAWLAARVSAAVMALGGVISMILGGKIVLLAVAAVLGAAFGSVSTADAQGVSGFIYARDGNGVDRQVYQNMYSDLSRFGNDMINLGRAYDGGVRALLWDSRTQVFITYAFTADLQNPGKDTLRATLDARNYNPNQPTYTQVFVGGFGGTLIGYTAGSMFTSAYGGKTRWGTTEQPY